MPHEQMDEQQVAVYLSMDVREIVKRAGRGQMPCRKTGEQKFQFRRADVDHWVWQQMHNFNRRELAGIERGVSEHHGVDAESPIVCPLIPDAGLAVPLKGKTRAAALRALVDQADAAELVYNREELLGELQGREQLCSTALLPGAAFPHPRHPLPYDIAASFVIAGLAPAGVPFGSEDGSLTRLFFLVCGKDDRTHLHVLARLVRMLDDPGVVEHFLECQTPEQLAEALAHREMEVLNRK
ncbi:MAG: PTS sugar transporter subunit IIA [Phycisphaerae bacterium]|nr:PTS sugar transporter subunit IIA [Phycisphaerae bacterium]